MNIRKLLACGLAAVLLGMGTVHAGPYDRFAALDRNQDGVVTHDETITAPELAKQFKSLDRNRSGSLEPLELRRMEASR